MALDFSKLKERENLFRREIDSLKRAEVVLDDYDFPEEIRKEFESLQETFYSSLLQTSKIVKISDKTQEKLRHARQEVEELNRKNQKYIDLINTELSRAAEYVTSIIPREIDEDLVRTSWIYRPSSKLGGDLLGYTWLDDENFIFFLIDVCGHGIRPALYSVSVCNTINYRNLPDTDFANPSSVMKSLNSVFQMGDHDDMYFTMFYGVFNKKSRKLKFASAGHPPGILIRNSSHILLECNNIFIGGIKGMSFDHSEIDVKDGDEIYIYSDGAYEIQISETELWSLDQFIEKIIDYHGDANEFEKLYGCALKLSGNEILDDDFSILKVKL
jgi:sigma-B regulation protein RsbU (phosphoserine phosphatase)